MLDPVNSTLIALSCLYPPLHPHSVLANASPMLMWTPITWGSYHNADSDPTGVEWSLRFWSRDKLPGDAHTAGLGSHFE